MFHDTNLKAVSVGLNLTIANSTREPTHLHLRSRFLILVLIGNSFVRTSSNCENVWTVYIIELSPFLQNLFGRIGIKGSADFKTISCSMFHIVILSLFLSLSFYLMMSVCLSSLQFTDYFKFKIVWIPLFFLLAIVCWQFYYEFVRTW